jgi:hypothetical protein
MQAPLLKQIELWNDHGDAVAEQEKIVEDSTKEIADDVWGYANELDLAVIPDAPAIKQEWTNALDGVDDAFSDLLGKGFSGELDSFEDLWSEVWGRMAMVMTGTLGDALSDWLGAGGAHGVQGFFESLGNQFQDMSTGERVGAGIGGGGMIVQGAQQGGIMGGLSAGMGALGVIGALSPALLTNPVGWAIAGGVALLSGLLGGSDAPDPPATNLTYGQGKEFFYTRNQEWSGQQDQQALQAIGGMYRDQFREWRNILKLFGDPGLWDNVKEMPIISTGLVEMAADDLLKWVKDVQLPKLFQQQFKAAIVYGLKNSGLDGEEGGDVIKQLFSELRGMSGDERMAALSGFVKALVGVNNLLADSSWDSLVGASRQGVISTFVSDIGKVNDQIAIMTMGWEDMNLTDRAGDLQEINKLFEGTMQGIIGYLQQIDSMRRGMNQGWKGMLEDLQLSQLGTGGKQNFFSQRISWWFDALQDAGSLNDISMANDKLMEYVQQLMSLAPDDLDKSVPQHIRDMLGNVFQFSPTDDVSWAELLEQLMETIMGEANDQLDEAEDPVREAYEELTDSVYAARDAFLDLTGVLDPTDAPPPNYQYPESMSVKVTIGDEELLSIIDARAEYVYSTNHDESAVS